MQASWYKLVIRHAHGGEVPGETPTEPDDTDFREIVIDRIEKIEAELQALKTLVEEHE